MSPLKISLSSRPSNNLYYSLLALFCLILLTAMPLTAGDNATTAEYTYDDWEEPTACGPDCHVDIYQQWKQSMMSQSYTHHWDEIEYFKLAVPHAEKDSIVAGVKAGCNGCHAPMSFLVGDIPPPRPSENSRANDGVHCDFCHTITGFDGDVPFNFNYVIAPGEIKYGPRENSDLAPH